MGEGTGFDFGVFVCFFVLVVRDALRRNVNFCGERNTDEINLGENRNVQR